MLGVEGDFRVGLQGRLDGIRHPVMGLLQHIAALINEARAPGVGRTGHATPVLDGAQFRELEMLSVAGCVSPPAVVGDDEKQVRALLAELADILAESRLVADGHACFMLAISQNLRLGVAFQGASGNAHGDAEILQKTKNDLI